MVPAWNWLRFLVLLLVIPVGLEALTGILPAQEPAATEEADATVTKLIEQLGANEFAAREAAQAELAKIGLEAFDALNDAQHHDDIEIALRARYVLRGLQVRWHRETDPADVIRILKDYGEQAEPERKSRMDRLATLTNREGIAALCRLARFETTEELSKHAALLVLQQPVITDEANRTAAAKEIAAAATRGKRAAALWLRIYAKTLQDAAATLPEWDAQVKAEHDLFTKFPERTSREVVRDLYRYEVTLLQELKRDQEAVAVMRRTLSLLEGTPDQLAELADWLLERQAWPVVQEVAERFPQAFAENAELLYRLAESQEKSRQVEAAKATAAKALAIKAENQDEHRRVARILQERGLFTWAEQEYRYVMKMSPPGSLLDLFARFSLSEMLHDQAQDLPAAEVLQGAVDVIKQDKQAAEQAERVREVGAWESRMNFFYALHYSEKKEAAKARQLLEAALKADPTDADVLIALYRLPDQSEADQTRTKEAIEKAAQLFRTQMNEHEAEAKQAPNEQLQGFYNNQLATACNQFAWLVGNTIGDYDESLRCSLRSVELRPDAGGYYDTLGRCYYAKGDFDNAIKYQTQALKLDPHSGQMLRQLAIFQKAKADQAAKPEGK